MKKVLLLGDSIRLNYMPKVFRELSDVAEINGPEDNCRFTSYTLWFLDEWLRTFGTPDVVHWNNGIWDASLFNGTDIFTPLPVYLQNLERIYNELKKTGAHIIFATTTPARDGLVKHNNRVINMFNAEALKMFSELDKNVEIDDLHTLIASDIDKYICEDNLHLSKEGINAAGLQVCDILKKYI